MNKYQKQDSPHFDYELYQIPEIPEVWLRGPRIDLSQPHIICIGAAQTFGRFVHRPFPRLLQDELGIPALNLAVGGAGPGVFTHLPMLRILDNAKLVVVQVFSGRSADNSLFRSHYGGITGDDLRTGEPTRLREVLENLMKSGTREDVRRLVEETQASYVAKFIELLDAIAPAKVLFWLGNRQPDYELQLDSIHGLMGEFPHLVNQAMIDQIRSHADSYVSCVSGRGLPQPLWKSSSKLLGTTQKGDMLYNRYYPSPEIHEDAAAALLPVCRELLDR